MTVKKWKWMITLSLFSACALVALPAIAQGRPVNVEVVNGDAPGHSTVRPLNPGAVVPGLSDWPVEQRLLPMLALGIPGGCAVIGRQR
jgi:hypothetical protein